MKTISALGFTALFITVTACQNKGDYSEETNSIVNSQPTGYEIMAYNPPHDPMKSSFKVNYDQKGRLSSMQYTYNDPLSYALEMYKDEGVDWETISVDSYVTMVKQTENYEYNDDNHTAKRSSKLETFSYSPANNKWSWRESNESNTIAFDDEWRIKSPYSGYELTYEDGYLSSYDMCTYVWSDGDLTEIISTASSGLTSNTVVTYSSEHSPFMDSIEPILPNVPDHYIYGILGKHCEHLPCLINTTVHFPEGTTQSNTCEIVYERDSNNRIVEVHYFYPNTETGEREETNYYLHITY